MSFFTNIVKVAWPEGEHRKMILLEDVSFIDDNGKEWTAPAGSEIDGASIPRFFWRVIGSPFVGKYRRASVIHDVYCVTRTEPYKAVHQMFYEAMKCDGVSKAKRVSMYNAVAGFGPKWDGQGNDFNPPPVKLRGT